MPLWLETIFELLKITIPAVIVYLTVFQLMKTFLDKQYQLKMLEHKQNQQGTTIPMRLQAYERLSLFCERIAIPSLILRLQDNDQSAAGLRISMLMAIQQEFEYNITQQLYVSEQLWQIIKLSREDTMNVINGISERVDPKAPAKDFIAMLLKFADSQQVTALDKALSAIKKEASILM